jgi:hypothetical protein
MSGTRHQMVAFATVLRPEVDLVSISRRKDSKERQI